MKLKNICLLAFSFLMLTFSSCKKETVDMTHLLTTVPSSASGVIVLNIEGLLQDAGCKIKDNVVTPSPEVKNLLEKASKQDSEDFSLIFNGDAGIEPKGAVVFYDANRAFLTFSLCDEKKFSDFVEKKTGAPFKEESGVKVNGTVAMRGAQAWVLLTTWKGIDADAIAAYAALGPAQSFLVTPVGEKLLVEEDDIRGWMLLNALASQSILEDFGNYFNMAFNMLFEDAQSVIFKADFKKGEMEAEAKILNEKFKPAKYQLPKEKLDVATLKSIGGNCEAFMAFTVDEKLVKKLQALGSIFGGPIFSSILDAFKNVSGTAGVAASGSKFSSMNGVVTTKGGISPILKSLISSNLAPVSQDGDLLRFSMGEVSGPLSVEECAEEFKGCCMGACIDASALGDYSDSGVLPFPFKALVLKMKPEDGSLELEVEIKSTDPDRNAIFDLLKGF